MENQTEDGILSELQAGFAESWAKLPNKSLFFTLLAAWFALYHFVGNSTLGYIHSPSLFRWVLDAYNPAGDYASSEDSIGLLVPLLILLRLFWIHKELSSLPLKIWTPGLLLVGLCLALHLLGYIVQQPRISMIAFLGGLYALTGLAWGP